MYLNVPVPFIIYWLIVRDFLYDTDFCDNNDETGYCLSESQCNNIVHGTNIGSCEGKSTGSICCKITLNYYNATYLLHPIFVRKAQTDKVKKMRLFSSDGPCSPSHIQYGGKTILLRKKRFTFYIPEIHDSNSPDRIFWPILASYSRESRDLKKQSSGTNYLYAVTLDKLDTDRYNGTTLTAECVPDADERDIFYLLMNSEEKFPIRKFFTPEMQKLNTMNLTIDASSLLDDEETKSVKRSRRSLDYIKCKSEDSTCKSKRWEEIIFPGESETDHDIRNKVTSNDKYMEDGKEMDTVHNNDFKSKSKLDIGFEKTNESFIYNRNKGASDELSTKEFYDSRKDILKDVKENQISTFQKIPEVLVKGSISVESGDNLESSIDSITVKSSTNDFQKRVETEDVRDMRKPVQLEISRSLRKPVEAQTNHDMRIPVQTHSEHSMRKPVQRELTHDMREQVISHESHDLRWPVLDSENNVHSYDTENGKIKNTDFLNCKVNGSFTHKYSNLDNIEKKKEQLNSLWKDGSTICGKYYSGISDKGNIQIHGKWSWLVSVYENTTGKYLHKCSASLLNSLWAVTVAHCVDMKPKSDILLVLGDENSKHNKGNLSRMLVDEIIIHPKFNKGMFENDIALLRMKSRVAFEPTVSPICLPWRVGELKERTPVFLAVGFNNNNSREIQNLTLPIITNYECEILFSTLKYKEKIKDTFLCTGSDDGSCDSESGSSLVTLDSEGRWSLIGLVSWGSICTNDPQPGVYTRISSYAHWIKDAIDCYEILM